jgi:hypothetical protein
LSICQRRSLIATVLSFSTTRSVRTENTQSRSRRAQSLGAVDDEHIRAVGRQAVIVKVDEQTLARAGVFRRAYFDFQNVFAAT